MFWLTLTIVMGCELYYMVRYDSHYGLLAAIRHFLVSNKDSRLVFALVLEDIKANPDQWKARGTEWINKEKDIIVWSSVGRTRVSVGGSFAEVSPFLTYQINNIMKSILKQRKIEERKMAVGKLLVDFDARDILRSKR